jgi:hypothetical protein
MRRRRSWRRGPTPLSLIATGFTNAVIIGKRAAVMSLSCQVDARAGRDRGSGPIGSIRPPQQGQLSCACSLRRCRSRVSPSGASIIALQRIRGIGSNFAAVLVREVLYRSFANRRQLASYVGITPMPYQSGSMDRDRSISRAGNPRARTTMIQLAWLWLRYQPGSALAAWFRERVGTLQGRTRRIAIVAMARRLLIALWRYVETGVLPEGVEIRAEAAPMA